MELWPYKTCSRTCTCQSLHDPFTPTTDMFALGLLTPVLLFISFLLLLLVTLSVPIIKTIFLFRLSAAASSGFLDSSASASVSFGVFGYCTSGIDVS